MLWWKITKHWSCMIFCHVISVLPHFFLPFTMGRWSEAQHHQALILNNKGGNGWSKHASTPSRISTKSILLQQVPIFIFFYISIHYYVQWDKKAGSIVWGRLVIHLHMGLGGGLRGFSGCLQISCNMPQDNYEHLWT